MRISQLLAVLLCTAGVAAPALACTPPPPQVVKLPAGPDGKLPVVAPELDPRYPFIPAPTPGMCPTAARFAYRGTIAGLSDSELVARFGSDVVPLAAPWQSAQVYNAGDRVSYQGANYQARWWTHGEAPGSAWGAWQYEEGSALPTAWSANRNYQAGERVLFDGKLFQARWWTQNEQPAVGWGAWNLLGNAPAGQINLGALPGLYSVTVSKAGGELTLNYQAQVVTQYTHRVTADCRVATEASTPAKLAERWEVHVDGARLYNAALTDVLNSGTQPPPPPPVRAPDGSCPVPAGTVLQTNSAATLLRGTAKVPAGPRFVSVWSCIGDQCRPSTLLDHARMGADAVGTPQYVQP
ncbi:carbohydrate-binding protein [Chitiniphilus purpureus]|uniref:Carbohydrate-binding protein n=1 Tax=Chitiniphilus purpureus TaxID=2981137 RepID=A0ABY6DKT9_9NEIS|nr:carbohydrate-binding protein [Chitiniphilus sp. CD1]UXY14970.1 carbohydrate-binding protein [Chitiniphilus sp. CD1]